jgi:adenosine kinase
VPKENSKTDPTGVGDNFRSGFIAGLSWGLGHERCAQLGSMLATYCLETTGTQEYRFTKDEFLSRFKTAYGDQAVAEITPHLSVNLVG